MLLLGLDPGLRFTGWGLIEATGSRLRHVACGTVASPKGEDLATRLRCLHEGVAEVVERWQPQEAGVEETVVNRNAGSSLKLGHARGVVILAAARAGLAVREYPSMVVKRAVTGTGHATKEQVAMMVRFLLPGVAEATGQDATDALAVAICHAHYRATERRVTGAVRQGALP
ncbi:crossover junction endodeoxyribonuclease RuvC [Geminicoccaceae bacterium 1502E]|nr:crossover junction endodeoxyribonuclease RuvC [Geminicoccaceae bacterium 1502E]